MKDDRRSVVKRTEDEMAVDSLTGCETDSTAGSDVIHVTEKGYYPGYAEDTFKPREGENNSIKVDSKNTKSENHYDVNDTDDQTKIKHNGGDQLQNASEGLEHYMDKNQTEKQKVESSETETELNADTPQLGEEGTDENELNAVTSKLGQDESSDPELNADTPKLEQEEPVDPELNANTPKLEQKEPVDPELNADTPKLEQEEPDDPELNADDIFAGRDGGYAWVIVLAFFIIELLVDGSRFSFGIFFVEFVNEFNKGKGETAWIGSIMISTYNISGLLVMLIPVPPFC